MGVIWGYIMDFLVVILGHFLRPKMLQVFVVSVLLKWHWIDGVA